MTTNSERGQMIPLLIDDLVDGMAIPVDLYVKLSEIKFVLVAKKGTKADRKQFANYKDKQLKYLWTPIESYYQLTEQNLVIAGIVLAKDNLNTKTKFKFITAASSSVFEELRHHGVNQDTLNNARQISEAALTMVESHKDIYDMITAFERYPNDLLKHSLAVSLFSVSLGIKLGWENKNTLEKLSLGGLLHDIGKLALPPEFLEKPLASLTYEERQLYESHPYKGMQMLTALGVVPDDIVSIAYEHHENAIGQGYPRRMRDLKIHPLAKVVGVADEFVNLTMRSKSHPHPQHPLKAVLYIKQTMGQPFNKKIFYALENLIISNELEKKAG